MIIVIMGVAGSGKTTVGSLLANELGWDFYDADDFHSEANRQKMTNGIPLTDEDRAGWLASLQETINKNIQTNKSATLACSALKESYRNILKVNEDVKFIYLHGTHEQLKTRLSERKGHYMSADMLDSQFAALEEPQDALSIDITHTPQEIIKIIRREFKL